MTMPNRAPSTPFEIEHDTPLEKVVGVDLPLRFEGPRHKEVVLAQAEAAYRYANENKNRDRSKVNPLTELPNRLALSEDLVRVQEHALYTDQRYFVGLIDLDGLKQVNDKMKDHVVGDKYIEAAADALRIAIRPNDKAYHIGGDEFLLLMPIDSANITTEALQEIMRERVTSQFKQCTNSSEVLSRAASEHGLRYGISLGVAEWDPLSQDFNTVRSEADESMYDFKEKNRQHNLVDK